MTQDPQDNIELSAEAQARQEADTHTATETHDPRDEELANIKDQLLRALAEMDNTRKRAEKSVSDARSYAISGFARDLLDVADNLRRAHDAIPETDKDGALAQGVLATERALLSVFERNGLKQVNPEGAKFDANVHEAMFEQPVEGTEPGTIIAVLEVGYTLNDRLIRPARVGVSKAA